MLLVSLGCSSVWVTLHWDVNPQWSVHEPPSAPNTCRTPAFPGGPGVRRPACSEASWRKQNCPGNARARSRPVTDHSHGPWPRTGGECLPRLTGPPRFRRNPRRTRTCTFSPSDWSSTPPQRLKDDGTTFTFTKKPEKPPACVFAAVRGGCD